MSNQEFKVRREAVEPCMICHLCHKLLRDATTIIECLHTFCRKCIYNKLADEEMESCPKCNINLGCVPLEKLRPDHNLQDIRTKIFPDKKVKLKATEVMGPVLLPAKRKERSLSSLVVSTPRVSVQVGMTGRRSKSLTRKAPRVSNFPIKKTVTNSIGYNPESSSSPETLYKLAQNVRQNSAAGEASNYRSPDRGKERGSEQAEAAIRSKSSKFNLQGSVVKSEELHYYENKDFLSKSKRNEQRKKSKVKDEKSMIEYGPLESEKPKKLRKTHQKALDIGKLGISPQYVLEATSAKLDRRHYPIWFSLVAADEQRGDVKPLPQISASYLRIKDGSIPVSFIQQYLKKKLDLTSEDEVDIKCLGQTVIPTLSLNNLHGLWLETISMERVSTTIGSSAKDFVMVLEYARRVSDR